MKAAPRSSRVVTNRIDEAANASITWRFSSPGRPKTYSTPSFSRHSTRRRATVRAPCAGSMCRQATLAPYHYARARGLPGCGSAPPDGATIRPAADPPGRRGPHHRPGASCAVGGLLARTRAPGARHSGDGRRVLGDDPRSRVRLGGGDGRTRADGADPAAPGSTAVPRALLAAGQDRVPHGRG